MDKVDAYILKLERENAIYKRDMRIVLKELMRIKNTCLPNSVECAQLASLIYLIKLLKGR